MLNGIDVSAWQNPEAIDYNKYDFVMIKATQGTGYVNEYLKEFTRRTKKAKKLLGYYHFADVNGDAKEQAKYFVTQVYNLCGSKMLALDVEGSDLNKANVDEWCREWLDYVQALTGQKPLLYVQQSAVHKFTKVCEGDYGLWVAQYNSTLSSIDPWKYCAMWQYSNSGGKLDLDKWFFNVDKWNSYCRGYSHNIKLEDQEQANKEVVYQVESTPGDTNLESVNEKLDAILKKLG